MGASPGAAVALTRMNAEIDIRDVLPSIRVPTLVLHRTGDRCLQGRGGPIPGVAHSRRDVRRAAGRRSPAVRRRSGRDARRASKSSSSLRANREAPTAALATVITVRRRAVRPSATCCGGFSIVSAASFAAVRWIDGAIRWRHSRSRPRRAVRDVGGRRSPGSRASTPGPACTSARSMQALEVPLVAEATAIAAAAGEHEVNARGR